MEPPGQLAARQLGAARVAGAAVVALLGQLAVDMPEGYFGAEASSTLLGAVFSGVVVVLAALAAWRYLTGRRLRRLLATATLVSIVGAFLWPLASDPVVAGSVIAWTLYLLGRVLLDPDARPPVRSRPTGDPAAAWARRSGPALRHLLLVSLVASTCAVGYGFERQVPAFATCAVLAVLAVGCARRLLLMRLRAGDGLAVAATLAALAGAATLWMPAVGLTLLIVAQLALLALLARQETLIRDLVGALYDQPAALLTASFVALILVGALLLSFPAAAADGRSIGPADAIFTATSAVCVTGLIVLDTPNDFSTFGHVVILLLIQVGGLNIMVLSAFAAVFLGRGLGVRGGRTVGSVLDIETPEAAYRLIVFIVKVTLGFELAGAVGLAFAYARSGDTVGEAVWDGVFHAVSAFCNAGFALRSDSVELFRSEPLALLLVAALITLGGLGFAVLGFLWRPLRAGEIGRLAVQSRIVLAASAVLVAAGTVAYLVGEWSGSLDGLSLGDKLTNAFFQSVTLRTAGFNSVGLEALRPVSVLWMMAFMFVGASPGGTGGGIKTTTAVVLFGAIPAFLRGRHRVVLWGRSISLPVVYQSAAIAVGSVVIVLTGSLLLLASQAIPFQSVLFEVVSAFGTVGLSLGATTQLDAFGKAVIVLVMLVGRVGPLSITLLLARDVPSRVAYPEARIMVG